MKKAYSIVFEDDYLIVVNKAAGVPVIPGRTSEMGKSLKYIFKEKYGDIFIVHRIDSDTSGLVILAKNAEVHRSLNTMFQTRQVQKQYLAITKGIPSPPSGEVDLSLKKLSSKNKSIVSKDGKAALSRYKVLKSYGNIGLVSVEILSGRHHQIRVHLSAINTPLLVDEVYAGEALYLSEIKGKKYKINKNEVERPLLKRLSLHAHKLEFIHPVTKETINIEADLPKDLRAVINQLDKTL